MHPLRPHPDRAAPPRPEVAALRLAQIAAGVVATTDACEEPDGADEPDDAWWSDHTRVAVAPAVAPPVEPPALPVPGRHAARRRLLPRLGQLRSVVPAPPTLAPAHLAVVAVVVAVGLAVTTWWVVHSDPGPAGAPVTTEPITPLVGDPAAAPSVTPAPSDTPPGPVATSTTSVTVDVAGKVRRPGIVVLDRGARVTDALDAAGGARRGVDLTALNLARVLVDGEQIVVGAPAGAVAGPAPEAAAPGPAGEGAPLVNLNHAGQSELETLPQVGPVTAQAIIAWREQRGGFTSVDELLEVDGIGAKTLARLTPYVTV